MSKKMKNGIISQIIAGIIVALLVGSTAPWWWQGVKGLFEPKSNSEDKPTITPRLEPTQPLQSIPPMPTVTPTSTPTPIQEIRIQNIIVRNEQGRIIVPKDNIYSLRLGETVSMTVDIIKPSTHHIEIIWLTSHDKISSKAMTNTYIATTTGSDYVIVYIRDLETGDTLEKPINIAIVP